MKSKVKLLAVTTLIATLFFTMTGCCSSKGAEKTDTSKKKELSSLYESPRWVKKIGKDQNADQLFVVAGVGETTAYVSMHQKDENGKWREIITTPGYIGKNGLGKEKEGDGKTPVGVYHFNYAFGIADDPGCVFPYHKVTNDNYWSGDQREGYHYNEMVSIKELPDLNVDDSEHIVDYPFHYQYCMNISWNEEGKEGKGSAIFLHCLGPNKPYTGGCVAIPQDKMITAMKYVKKDCVVVIDELKKIAPDYYEDWDLGQTPIIEDVSSSKDTSSFPEVSVDKGSDLYTEEDINSAAEKIMNEFRFWKGCEMHSIRYAGDECNSEENIKWMNELKKGQDYVQCIEFLTDFHSPTKGENLKNTAWEPDQEYKDYTWYLARKEGGDWELLSWGY